MAVLANPSSKTERERGNQKDRKVPRQMQYLNELRGRTASGHLRVLYEDLEVWLFVLLNNILQQVLPLSILNFLSKTDIQTVYTFVLGFVYP